MYAWLEYALTILQPLLTLIVEIILQIVSQMERDVYLIQSPAQHIKVHKLNAIYFMVKLEHINVIMMGQPHQLQLVGINYVQIYQELLLVLVTHKYQDV